MKKIIYILGVMVMVTLAGCEDMKMDKNVEKHIVIH